MQNRLIQIFVFRILILVYIFDFFLPLDVQKKQVGNLFFFNCFIARASLVFNLKFKNTIQLRTIF